MTTYLKQNEQLLAEAAALCEGGDITQGLKLLVDHFSNQVCFSTSFSLEDQAITHLICESQLPVSIFTLDTGRLFSETYSTWSRTLERFGEPIQAYYPDNHLLQSFVNDNGPNAFYDAVSLRQQCCYIRKVEPLQRALQNMSVWITGIRAEHSNSRDGMQQFEWDESNKIFKLHPLLHWKQEELVDFIRKNNVPYNPLHDKGFVSIGCAPCTRAIKPGDDPRSGRWWWEEADKKECGLHIQR